MMDTSWADRVANATPKERVKIKAGNHRFALTSFEGQKSDQYGFYIAVGLRVVESTVYQPMTKVDHAFFISSGPGWAQDRSLEACQTFIRGLLGATTATPAELSALAVSLAAKEQVGRGILIDCVATEKTSTKGKDYLKIGFEHVAGQTNEQITAMRAKLDQLEAKEVKPQTVTASIQPMDGTSILAKLQAAMAVQQ